MSRQPGEKWDYKGRCPVPHKMLFPDKPAAKDWLKRHRRELEEPDTMYPYRCMCGCWHMTSTPRWKATILNRIMYRPQIKNENLFKRFLKK